MSFSRAQRKEIELAKSNMTQEQIGKYMTPSMAAVKMRQIRLGIENDLTEEQIELYAKKDYTREQMQEIREGLEYGLSIEQVKYISNPTFSPYYMSEIKECLLKRLDMEKIQLLTNPQFNIFQVKEIKKGFFQGLNISQVSEYALPNYGYEEMREIRLAYKEGISNKLIKWMIDKKFYDRQIKEVVQGIKDNLECKQIGKYAKSSYSHLKMRYIRRAILYDFSSNEIEDLKNLNFDYDNEKLRELVLRRKLKIEDFRKMDSYVPRGSGPFDIYPNEKYKITLSLIEEGWPIEKVIDFCACSRRDFENIQIKKFLEAGLTKDQIEFIGDKVTTIDDYSIVRLAIERRVDFKIIRAFLEKELNDSQFHTAIELTEDNCTVNEALFLCRLTLDTHILEEYKWCLNQEFDWHKLSILNDLELPRKEIREVRIQNSLNIVEQEIGWDNIPEEVRVIVRKSISQGNKLQDIFYYLSLRVDSN